MGMSLEDASKLKQEINTNRKMLLPDYYQSKINLIKESEQIQDIKSKSTSVKEISSTRDKEEKKAHKVTNIKEKDYEL